MYISLYLEVFGFQTSGYNLVYKETLYVIWGACVSCIFRYIRTFVVSKLPNITKNTRDVFAWCQYVMNTCLYWKSGMTKVFLCRMWFCNEAVIIIYLLQANIGNKNFRSTFFYVHVISCFVSILLSVHLLLSRTTKVSAQRLILHKHSLHYVSFFEARVNFAITISAFNAASFFYANTFCKNICKTGTDLTALENMLYCLLIFLWKK